MLTQLTAEDFRLLLVERTENDWTSLVVSWPLSAVRLGADRRGRVVSGLLAALEPEGLTASGELGGVEVGWALSLSEDHGSVYAARLEVGRVGLYFQDADANLVGSIVLGEQIVASWKATLEVG